MNTHKSNINNTNNINNINNTDDALKISEISEAGNWQEMKNKADIIDTNDMKQDMKHASNVKSTILNYGLFLIGLFIASMGVAFSTKAGLGTSPVASVPYSVSLISGLLSFGGWLNLWSVIQISVQVILLRSKCNPIEIVIQTVLAFAYGYMTNFSCSLLNGISVIGYGSQLLFMAAGCFILAFGIWLQFKGGVAMLPGEAMNRAISTVTGKKYENVKIFFDIFYIVVSVIICLAAFGKLSGVREGSIVAAVAIGNIIKVYNWIFNKLTSKQ